VGSARNAALRRTARRQAAAAATGVVVVRVVWRRSLMKGSTDCSPLTCDGVGVRVRAKVRARVGNH